MAGGMLQDNMGSFRSVCEVMGWVCLGYGILYGIIMVLPGKQRERKIEEIKSSITEERKKIGYAN